MSSPASHDLPSPPAALLAEVKRDCDALARARRRRLGIFAVLALGLVLGFGAAMGWRSGIGFGAPGCGSPMHTLILAGFAIAGLSLVALAFGLALPAGRSLRTVPFAGLGLGLVGLAALALLYGPEAHKGHGGLPCLTTGGATSLVLVGLAMVFGRRVIRRHAPSAGLFGVGVGLLALIPLSLACHDTTMPHLMIWHGLIPVVGGLLAIAIWRVARPV